MNRLALYQSVTWHSYFVRKHHSCGPDWLLLACAISTTKQQRFPTADSEKQFLAFSYRSRSSMVKFSSSSNLKIKT
jgi:hypothetical protein